MSYMLPDTFAAVDDGTARAMLEAIEPYKAPLGIDDLQLMPTEDYTGDPVIYARFKHRLVTPSLASRALRHMEMAVRDAAWEQGERRFVHVRHEFDERQLLDTSL